MLRRFSLAPSLDYSVPPALITLHESDREHIVRFVSKYIQSFLLSEYFNIVELLSNFEEEKREERYSSFEPGISLDDLVFPNNARQVHYVDTIEPSVEGGVPRMKRCLSLAPLAEFEELAKRSH